MITRAVPSIKGQSESSGYDSIGFQGRVRPPEDILRQARATSSGPDWLVFLSFYMHDSEILIISMIASVASYALDILQELKDETTEVQGRMAKLHERVDIVAEVVDSQIRQQSKGLKSEPNLLHLLPSQEESDRVLQVQTISSLSSTGTKSNNDRPAPVIKAYERCEGVPPLELLDNYYDSQQGAAGNLPNSHTEGSYLHVSSISRKKYSNPGFFMEEWLKYEVGRQQRALEIKEERRRERREAQNLRKVRELDQQRQTTSTDDAQSSASIDDAEQKLKFLKIRSWREIYGTGEGKELMKQQQSGRTPSLRELRKKAQQSLASITHSPPRTEERHQPASAPPPPPPQDEPTQTFTEQFVMTTPPDPPSIPTSLGGAFMQEMDDDELEEEFTNGIPPPPPPLADSRNADEFTDHGLSYYYDPAATHNLTPPPPPPPELDEQSKSDAYYDACDEEDHDIPPPPPMEEYELPPSELPRASSLLEEIQLGASLRSVKDRQPQREAPGRPLSPQAALLQQILQKQSRHLRPIEPRSRPAIQTRHTSAPFADSIARILDRRSMIAYDSDSDSHQSNDDDW
ncbi:hypothetical protein PHPALM_28175 [Phytophthora palmivora]|uniref:Wiskott-Aldrich syndrome protein family member n=1 Tax=Phytophthora palmivora TaxID=4796 RepID=A0A2P4XAQ9_9STRA|nr:hypothetical protein PHPALM_28175 [Phytophthora palmivora]